MERGVSLEAVLERGIPVETGGLGGRRLCRPDLRKEETLRRDIEGFLRRKLSGRSSARAAKLLGHDCELRRTSSQHVHVRRQEGRVVSTAVVVIRIVLVAIAAAAV